MCFFFIIQVAKISNWNSILIFLLYIINFTYFSQAISFGSHFGLKSIFWYFFYLQISWESGFAKYVLKDIKRC